MIKSAIITIGVSAFILQAKASTLFQFNEFFSGGISSNLSDAIGSSAVNGLYWGVIVDKDGGGLSTTTFDPITLAFNSTIALTSGLAATDAVLVIAGDFTGDQSFGGAFTDVGGTTGTAGGVSGITVNYTNGIASGQSFLLVWFDPSGTQAGSLASNEFLLPTDTGATLTVDDVFIGADPIRPATGITFVPEPSSLLLGALGALCLLRRKR